MNDLLLIASIADRRCAFRAEQVQSVIDLGKITPIPCAPDYIVGMTALRSQALTVIDCRRVIGEDPAQFGSDMRAPVVSVNGHSYALVIDKVEDVTETGSEAESVIGGFGEEWTRISKGMIETADGPVLLLDVDAIISVPGEQVRAA